MKSELKWEPRRNPVCACGQEHVALENEELSTEEREDFYNRQLTDEKLTIHECDYYVWVLRTEEGTIVQNCQCGRSEKYEKMNLQYERTP